MNRVLVSVFALVGALLWLTVPADAGRSRDRWTCEPHGWACYMDRPSCTSKHCGQRRQAWATWAFRSSTAVSYSATGSREDCELNRKSLGGPWSRCVLVTPSQLRALLEHYARTSGSF